MEREQILRDDFPTSRKGWSPDAVRAHLHAVADSHDDAAPSRAPAPLADAAAERVRSVIAAAEEAAAEVEADARAAADNLLSGARAESERIVDRAKEEAGARVEQARVAVEGLISQAGELRTRVGTLGEELAGSMGSSAAAGTAAEVPGPAIIPEPTPPAIPEPSPDPIPEPTPDPVPEPTPDPMPEPPGPSPFPDLPDAPEPPPPTQPDPLPPAAVRAGASTDELIAQLRSASGGSPANGTVAAAASGTDLGAARLVAMNMALEGAPREQIAAHIGTEFGDVADLDALLDEVLTRAGR